MMILASIALMVSGVPGTNAAGGRPICTSANATPTRLEVVLADPASWQGRCVRITGIVSGARLYADRGALADWMKGPSDADAKRAIQLYRGRRVLVRSPAWRVVIGTIDSCVRENEAVEDFRHADSDSLIMVGGFCHTSLEPYFTPTAIRRASRRGTS